jgi:hypothetical protein
VVVTVEVIEALSTMPARAGNRSDHGHGVVPVQVHVNDHGVDHAHGYGRDHVPELS